MNDTRQWKLGDVAMVNGNVALRIGKAMARAILSPHDEDVWMFHHGGFVRDKNVEVLNPLVVIDPEDPEQVMRLLKAFWAHGTDDCDDLDAMSKGLRSLVTDPKPDEPQGLGAVVEDAEGERWVRSHTHVAGAPWTRPNLSGTFRWGQVDAVRVLSEGWSE